MKYLKTFEGNIKEDDHYHKYEVGDIVMFRNNKINRNRGLTNEVYTIMECRSSYVTLFSGPTRQIRKNAYFIKSDEDQFGIEVRENEIRKLSPKQIKQFKFEQELNKYNL